MSDILSDEEKAALAVGPDDEPNPETNDQQQADQAAEEQRQAEERARDEKGRFVAKEEGDDQQQVDDKPKGDGKVPQGALHAERERRKAAEQRAEQYQAQLNRIAEMRAKLNGGEQQEQQQQQDDPDSVEYLKRK